MKLASMLRPIAPLEVARPIPGEHPCWEASIPALPPSENTQRRMHFAAIGRIAKEWHWWLHLAFLNVPKATGLRRVTFIRHGAGLLDEGDNLAASYKFVRDLLRPQKTERGIYGPRTKNPGMPWERVQAGVGMIIGDGPGQAEFVYLQEKVKRDQPLRTMIRIEDLA